MSTAGQSPENCTGHAQLKTVVTSFVVVFEMVLVLEVLWFPVPFVVALVMF